MTFRRLALLLTLALVTVALLARPSAVSASEFHAPVVTVELSERVASGHPNLRTVIQLDEGATFDQVVVLAPPGSGIAADAEFPVGSIVGRLDGEATTNAITRPACDFHSTFSLLITEATTDLTSPTYPDYVRQLAPG